MKRTTLLAVLLVPALCLGALSASAQVQEGDSEISAFAALINTDVEDSEEVNTLIIQLAGGHFLNDNAQVGGSFTQSSFFNDIEVSVRTISGFFKYHVNPQDVAVPYIGGQAGMTFAEFDAPGLGSDDDTGVSYGGMAGLKYFMSEDLSVNGEFNLLFSELFDVDVTQTTMQLGLSYYF